MDLSPDGTRIAATRSPAGPIYILSLRREAMRQIQVKGWSNLLSLNWATDGNGLFVADGVQGGAVLLHVDLQGNARVLWKNHGGNWTPALPSVWDLSEELAVRNPIKGNAKIRVVEEVEELETDPQQALLPTGELRVFHDRKVGVEVTWAAEATVPLGESHSGAATWA